MKQIYPSEFWDYCERNQLMPTDELYQQWLKELLQGINAK